MHRRVRRTSTLHTLRAWTCPRRSAAGSWRVSYRAWVGPCTNVGLTIQRRSHLHNERLPEEERRSEWHRPLWVAGFIVFLAANISGTIFQIGTLPIVILAPLGAVSLLYNALLARALLDDFLSQHMLLGTPCALTQARR